MDPVFVGGVVDKRPLGGHVEGETADEAEGREGDEWVEEEAVGREPFAPFVGHFQVGQHDGDVEVGAPGEGIPVEDDADGIEAEPFPRCFDFADHDHGKDCLP